jgi:hypothetical protein
VPSRLYSAITEPTGSASTISRSGCTRLKKRQPGQRAGRPDADHNGVQIMLGLRPDLRGGTALVGQRVGRVVELVGEEGVGDVLCQRAATSW